MKQPGYTRARVAARAPKVFDGGKIIFEGLPPPPQGSPVPIPSSRSGYGPVLGLALRNQSHRSDYAGMPEQACVIGDGLLRLKRLPNYYSYLPLEKCPDGFGGLTGRSLNS